MSTPPDIMQQYVAYTAATEADLPAVAKKVLQLVAQRKNLAFYGQVGAGKTTFIKQLCKALGCDDVTSSPSYALVNEYSCTPANGKHKVYHADLYRLDNAEEAYHIGIEEYLDDPQAWCLVEWPELIEHLFDDNLVKLNFTINPDNSRTITIEL